MPLSSQSTESLTVYTECPNEGSSSRFEPQVRGKARGRGRGSRGASSTTPTSRSGGSKRGKKKSTFGAPDGY